MPYIDSDFYLDIYNGLDASSPDELNKNILRANDTIDLLTNYIFVTGGVDFNSYNSILKAQVQKATAALVEHYIINGGYDALKQSQSISGAGIGAFNVSTKDVQEIPDTVFSLLYSTGLMYTGVDLH